MSRRDNHEATESSRNKRNKSNHRDRSVEDIIIRIELQLSIEQSENEHVRVTRTTGNTTRNGTAHSNCNTITHSVRECNPTWDARRGEQRHPSWGPGQPTRPIQPRTARSTTRQRGNGRTRLSRSQRTGRRLREIAGHAVSSQNQEQGRQPRGHN